MSECAVLHGIRGAAEVSRLGGLVIGRTLELIILVRDRVMTGLLLLLLLLMLLHHWGWLICWRRVTRHILRDILRSSKPLTFPGAEAEEDNEAQNKANE